MKSFPVTLGGHPLWRMSNWIQRCLIERVLLRRLNQRVYLILGGHIFFQTLSAAVELDLFSILQRHKQMTREQIAKTLNCAEQPIRILLLGCTTLGLLRKRGQSYSNTMLSRTLLVRSSARNIVDVVRWQHHINYRAMSHFADAIRANSNVGLEEFRGTEDTLYERLAHDEWREQIFQDAMESISVQANAMLVRRLNLRGAKFLLDVGGGNGTNIIAFARRFPNLRAAVFDSASVCEIARKNIAKVEVSDRLSACPGNCFSDPFPKEVDTILFAHFMTIWSETRNRQLLRKCFDALPTGGSVIIFNMMQWDSEDGPPAAAMGSPYFLTIATGEGMLYTWHEYRQWMRDAGFRSIESQPLPRDHGLIIGRKL
ncbi:MAG: methyltransferase domain-containing protein [Chthoniobacterales bacterium]|nr:methyltransferase domain-containing protein [Chthoniobacterales bacterium]